MEYPNLGWMIIIIILKILVVVVVVVVLAICIINVVGDGCCRCQCRRDCTINNTVVAFVDYITNVSSLSVATNDDDNDGRRRRIMDR